MEKKERKITALAVSRYGQGRYLHDDRQGQIWMTGNMLSTQFSGDKGNIISVDPDGGPYIEVGEDLEPYYKDGYSRVVEKIEVSGVIKLWYKTEQDDNR